HLEVAAPTIVRRALAPLLRGLAARFQLLRGAPASVDVPALEQLLRACRVERIALALEERPIVPVDAEPGESLEILVHRFLGGALAIRVPEAEHEGTAVVAGEEPVEER